MSSPRRPQDKPSLDDLRALVPQPPSAAHLQTQRDIESKAGIALTREYWTDPFATSLGMLSRRAIAFTLIGVVLTCVVFSMAISWRLHDVPDPVILPLGDARTVITHIYANFGATNKDTGYEPFFAPEGEEWFFTDAYTFSWVDTSGTPQRVVILSYPDVQATETDYYARTRLLSTVGQNESTYRSPAIIVELSSLPQRSSEWKGIHINNILMIMTPTVTLSDQQQLYSHLMTITAAGHRDFIPTATPY